MMYDILVFKKISFFVRPRENDNPAFLKNPTLGNVFKNLRFWCPKPLFTCGRKARKKKNLRYSKKYPHTCGRSLRGTFTVSQRNSQKEKRNLLPFGSSPSLPDLQRSRHLLLKTNLHVAD